MKDRFEWYALDFTGEFTVSHPGSHAFRTMIALQLFVTPPGDVERLWTAKL